MINKVLDLINKYKLIGNGSELLVALSGGADSVALLLIMNRLKEKFNLKISAIHINHNIRGEEALRDQNFCVDLCKKLGVNLIIESINILELARSRGQSIELCAREERYRLFSKHSNGLIATAHNANDNSETILYNLCRGTGINGISGIPIKRGSIIRPLISCTRNEIEEYLKDNNQEYIIDSTNLSDDYTRNKIRHNVIPILEEINDNFIDQVSKFAFLIKDDAAFINKSINKLFFKYLNSKYYYLSLDLVQESDYIKRKILYVYLKGYKEYNFNIDFLLINEMLQVINGSKKTVNIKKDLFFTKFRGGFTFFINKPNKCFNYKVDINNNCIYNLKFEILHKKDICLQNINKNMYRNLLDYDKIIGDLYIRNYNATDKYILLNRNVNKSVKKLLSESYFTPNVKQNLYILYDDEGIVYTNLFGIAHRVRVDDSSQTVIKVYSEYL